MPIQTLLAVLTLLFVGPAQARGEASCPSRGSEAPRTQALMQMHSHQDKHAGKKDTSHGEKEHFSKEDHSHAQEGIPRTPTLPPKHKNITAPPSLIGSPKCPCIGLSNLAGETVVVLNGTTKARYPASVGSHCKAWDDGQEPLSCKTGGKPGKGNGWCAKQWCFVDPCNCELEVKPKASSYLPDGMYQGKPVYYSYDTCGAKDTWNDEQDVKMQPADESTCRNHIHSSIDWGKDECKCIGINGEPGSTHFTVSGEQVAFPADAGTMCKAWDLESNPQCTANSTDIPAWCAKRWCWVDPCSCSLAVPPRTSSYLPYVSYEAKAMYYSYDTCGDYDLWTATHHEHACVNQKSQKACSSLNKCGWDADKKLCLGRELIEECKHPTFENASDVPKAHKKHKKIEDQKHTHPTVARHPPKFGDASCPCVGLDNTSGHTLVVVNGTRRTRYPADLGAHCEAWDDGREPISCQEGQNPGKGHGWCAQQWCFVDPCNCNIDVKPKTSNYLPSGRYQGKPIYYSYATCGGKDTWNSQQKQKTITADPSMCKKHSHDSGDWGKDECKCIGVHGESGDTLVTIGEKEVEFPADTGTMCRAWDLDNNPSCSGNGTEIPRWCSKKWCYVDPCSCSLASPPKTSSYLSHSSVDGRAIFYSYSTCGDEDVWTAKNHQKACANQKSRKSCVAQEKCGWDASKEQCLGKELIEECRRPRFLEGPKEHHDHKMQISTEAKLKFGNTRCPCVALDNITGDTVVMVNSTTKAYYPADLGAHCSAWDDDREPLSCKEGQNPGKNHGWCAQKWCFVDPCNCNIHVEPKASSYLPDGLYQGKPVYYSYDTCGGNDTWNDERKVKMKAVDKSLCKRRTYDSDRWGKNECKCIGIHGELGSTNFTLDGKQVSFPADAGATCKAWDLESNPTCTAHSTEVPMWCVQKWCYVDPCSCSLAEIPKVSTYMRDASHDGRTIYYSYDTCGSTDYWTAEHNKDACINQNSSTACVQDGCAWDAEKSLCLGKELLDDCEHPKHLYDKPPPKSTKIQGWWWGFPTRGSIRSANGTSAHSRKTSESSRQVVHKVAKNTSRNIHKLAHNHKVPLPAMYGSPECPCIGIDNLTGFASVLILQKLKVKYPADVGSHCAPWDDGHQPLSCMEDNEPGRGQGWCAQPWCFVDPCNCDIAVKPSITSYLPDGSYQGKPIYYSYATCGGSGDGVSFSSGQHSGAGATGANQPSIVPREINTSPDSNDRELAMCRDSPDESLYGQKGCRCVGIGGALGSVNLTVSGHPVAYPASTGSSCQAWDLSNHPDCHRHAGGKMPEWCEQRWCYIDPCTCVGVVPPVASTYLPLAVVQGRPLYYSYGTCGSKDTWTSKHHSHACAVQKSATDCKKLDKCSWDNSTALCQGEELARKCGRMLELKSFAPRAGASFWSILLSVTALLATPTLA